MGQVIGLTPIVKAYNRGVQPGVGTGYATSTKSLPCHSHKDDPDSRDDPEIRN